jgi:hypothetical protein
VTLQLSHFYSTPPLFFRLDFLKPLIPNGFQNRQAVARILLFNESPDETGAG